MSKVAASASQHARNAARTHSNETIIDVKHRALRGQDEISIANELKLNITSVRRFLGKVKPDARRSREALLRGQADDAALQARAEERYRAEGGIPPPYAPVAWAHVVPRASDRAAQMTRRRDANGTSSPPPPQAKRAKKVQNGTTAMGAGFGSGGAESSTSNGGTSTLTAREARQLSAAANTRKRPIRRFFNSVEIPKWSYDTPGPYAVGGRLATASAPQSRGSSPGTRSALSDADALSYQSDSAAPGHGRTRSDEEDDYDDGAYGGIIHDLSGQGLEYTSIRDVSRTPPKPRPSPPPPPPPPAPQQRPEQSNSSAVDDGVKNPIEAEASSTEDQAHATDVTDIGHTPPGEHGMDEGVNMNAEPGPGADISKAIASGMMEVDAQAHERERGNGREADGEHQGDYQAGQHDITETAQETTDAEAKVNGAESLAAAAAP